MKKNCNFFFLLIVTVSATALAQKVSVDFDRSVDFSKYETYTLQEGTVVNEPLVHQRIVAAIEYQLAMQGIHRVESDPDMLVTYHTSVREELQFNTTNWGYGWSRMGSGTSTTTTYRYLVGTLVVDMWDPKEENLLWRGTASATVTDKPEKKEKKINKAAEKMFKDFPPRR